MIKAFATISLDDSQDTKWCMDTGATSHMTDDVDDLEKFVPYTSNQWVVVGSSHSLPISSIGSISYLVDSHPLKMFDILLIPHITKLCCSLVS